jgi:hypothetical protein
MSESEKEIERERERESERGNATEIFPFFNLFFFSHFADQRDDRKEVGS